MHVHKHAHRNEYAFMHTHAENTHTTDTLDPSQPLKTGMN
jgi:hypothetical protein